MSDREQFARRRDAIGGGPGEEPGVEPSSLLEQARGWGAAAREAHADCQKGVDAENELRQRRNRSGQ